jgi:hypothetical protein
VVDATTARGTNSTDLPAAIAAAAPGDVLVVKPGNYSGFTLSKGLTIVGESGVNVTPAVTIANVAAGEVAVLSRIALRRANVFDCVGAVVIDQSTFLSSVPPSAFYAPAMVQVRTSADVRFQRCEIRGTRGITNGGLQSGGGVALAAVASRVELTGCQVFGGDGSTLPDCSGATPGWGATAVYCSQSSRVHIALSSVTGGNGGTPAAGCPTPAGNGGHGITMIEDSTVIVAGLPAIAVAGGQGGSPEGNGRGCYIASGTLRYSGATIDSILDNGNTVLHAEPDDPTLELIGDPAPGATLTFRLHGVAGDQARLQEGHQPLVIDDGLAPIEKLNERLRPYPLGVIPPSGQVDYATTLTNGAPAGRLRVMQGLELDPTFTLLGRTNSVVTVVRD